MRTKNKFETKLLFVILLAMFSISISAKKIIDLDTRQLSKLEIGMPTGNFKIVIENVGEELKGSSSLQVDMPEGMQIVNFEPTAIHYKANGTVENFTITFTNGIFSLPYLEINSKDSIEIQYKAKASSELIKFDSQLDKDLKYSDQLSFSMSDGSFTFSETTTTYNVSSAYFILEDKTTINADWLTPFTDSFLINNSGPGQTPSIDIYCNMGASSNYCSLDSVFISSNSDASKRYKFKKIKLVDASVGVYQFTVNQDTLALLGLNSANSFLSQTGIKLDVCYTVNKYIKSNIQIIYQVKWDAKTKDGNQALIASGLRILDIAAHIEPTASLSITGQIQKHPKLCADSTRGEANFTVSNNYIGLTNTIVDMEPYIKHSSNIIIDSLILGGERLVRKSFTQLYSRFLMPAKLPNGVTKLRNRIDFDGRPDLYNDLEPGGNFSFTVFYHYRKQTNQEYTANQYATIEARVYGSRIDNTSQLIYTKSFNDYNLKINSISSGDVDAYIGDVASYFLSLVEEQKLYYQQNIACEANSVELRCHVPPGFVNPAVSFSTPDVKATTIIPEDLSLGYDIIVRSSAFSNSKDSSIIGKQIKLSLTPECEAVGEDTIRWELYYRCNNCQSADSLQFLTSNYFVTNVIPNSTCYSGGGQGTYFYPTLNAERINYGYYLADKTGISNWSKAELERDTARLEYASPKFKTLLANGQIDNKLLIPTDTLLSELKVDISESLLTNNVQTIEAEFYYSAKNSLFNVRSALIEYNGTTYTINASDIVQDSTSGLHRILVKLPLAMIGSDRFSAGSINTKLYTVVKAGLIGNGASVNIKEFRARYNLICPDTIIHSGSIGDKKGLAIYNPKKMTSGSMSWNEKDDFGNVKHKLNYSLFQPYLSDYGNSFYHALRKEFRQIIHLDSIIISKPTGYDLKYFVFLSESVVPENMPDFYKLNVDKVFGYAQNSIELIYWSSATCNSEYMYKNIKACSKTITNTIEYPDCINSYTHYYPVGVQQISDSLYAVADEKNVNWNISVRASASGYRQYANWLIFHPSKKNQAGLYINSIEDQTGKTVSTTIHKVPVANSLSDTVYYVNVGKMSVNVLKNLVVKARYRNCYDTQMFEDTLLMTTGWSALITDPVEKICEFTNNQTRLVMLNKPTAWDCKYYKNDGMRYGICQPIDVSLSLRSIDIGGIRDIGFWFKPLHKALSLVNNQVRYTYGTYTGYINADSLFIPNNQVISTRLAADHNLKDSYSYNGDSIMLNFQLKLDCLDNENPDLRDAGKVEFSAQGFTACANRLQPANYLYNIPINGFEASDYLTLNVTAQQFSNKSGSAAVNVGIKNDYGSTVDKLFVEVILPDGIAYKESGTLTPVISGKTLLWEMSVEQSLNFSFTVTDESNCAAEKLEVPVRAYLLRNVPGCTTSCLFQKTFGADTLVFDYANLCPGGGTGSCTVNAGADVTVCIGVPHTLMATPTGCAGGTVQCNATTAVSPYTCPFKPQNGSANITVYQGQTTYVRNYTGSVTLKGGELVICGTGTDIPVINVDACGTNSGKVIINGTASFNTININGGLLEFANYGTATYNQAVSGALVNNYGTMSFKSDFSNTHNFLNTGQVQVQGNLLSTSSFVNNGTINISANLENNAGSDFTNNCRINTANFINNAVATNAGYIKASAQANLVVGSTYNAVSPALLESNTLKVDGAISAETANCTGLTVHDVATVGASASVSGIISVCGISSTNSASFNAAVSYNCNCNTYTSSTLQYLWSPAVGLNNPTLQNPTILSPLTSGTYTVTVTDATGKVATDSVQVNVESCTE